MAEVYGGQRGLLRSAEGSEQQESNMLAFKKLHHRVKLKCFFPLAFVHYL